MGLGEPASHATPTRDPVHHDFDALYRHRHAASLRTASLITGSKVHAEEIVQDAFLQLYRRWDRVEHPSAWLRAAVVSGCRSWQRRQVLERRHARTDGLAVTDPDGLAVRQALRVLTPRQRAAVVLRYFDDLPEADIARALGCRPGTVKSLLARSMTKLEEALRHD